MVDRHRKRRTGELPCVEPIELLGGHGGPIEALAFGARGELREASLHPPITPADPIDDPIDALIDPSGPDDTATLAPALRWQRYRYDSLGRLIGRDTPDGSHTYRYDGLDRLIGEQGATLGATYRFDPAGNRLSVPTAQSTTQPTTPDDPELAFTGATDPIECPIRLPGQFFDAETGLHYNRHRYYDPHAGRYVTQDPIGLEGGVNIYSYGLNNPLRFVDPQGLDIVVIGGGVRDGSLNLAGHVAVGVTGAGVFSYGNDTPLGSSVTAYIGSQSAFRNQTVTIIPTTVAQDAAALAYLLGQAGMNSVGLIDNCAVRTNSTLGAASIDNRATPFPGSVARAAMELPGAQTFFVPQGDSMPAGLVDALRQFVPLNVP